MNEPTMEEVLELVVLGRGTDGTLCVKGVNGNVYGDIDGNIWGNVEGDVVGNVYGTINGRQWQPVETPKEKAIRLMREGEIEEAIKVLEGE